MCYFVSCDKFLKKNIDDLNDLKLKDQLNKNVISQQQG